MPTEVVITTTTQGAYGYGQQQAYAPPAYGQQTAYGQPQAYGQPAYGQQPVYGQ